MPLFAMTRVWIGVLLAVALFCTLVVGDPTIVLTLTSAKVTNNPNDYFDLCTTEIIKTKKSSQLTINIPTKKELSPTMKAKFTLGMVGEDPFEYVMSVCDALIEPFVGSSIVEAGIPNETFPKACPFGPGDWIISKWDPPTQNIPPGIPDGPFVGSFMFFEEGQSPFVQIDIEGEVSHAIPGLGR